MMGYRAMNPTIKELWIEALRSGKYRQGTGQMRQVSSRDDRLDPLLRRGRFDALGVLCDTVDPYRWTEPARGPCVYRSGAGSVNARSTYLPRSLMHAVEIDPATMRQVARLNDSGLSLRSIAEFVEKNL